MRFLLLPLLAVFPLFPQATGRITGSVADPTGAKIPNAKVSLLLPGGKSAILSTQTSGEGRFDFAALRPESYDLTVEAPGFLKSLQTRIKVDPARETNLPAITLSITTASQTVEVSAAAATVQSTTFEVATTTTQKQVENLPVRDRQIANLFALQAGVTSNKLFNTVVNGLRPSYTSVTLDGINVQDNWVRTNTLDFIPNRLTIGQVAEMTVSTSNTNVAIGGGASQVTMVSPSGTNIHHGSLYWFNRNSAAAANDWFNNQNGVTRPQLNLNQLGGTIGGPIVKDKLLFYGNYEAFRRRSQTPVLNTVLTPSARQGNFRYRDASGTIREFNVLRGANATADPFIQSLLAKVPENGNSNQLGDGLNTQGFSFNAASNIDRDIVTAKVDYYLTSRHALAGTYLWNRDVTLRPTQGTFYTTTPPVSNDNRAALLSGAWRWTAAATLTNELRGGYNRTKGPFKVANPTPDLLLTGLLFTSPLNNKLPEGRDTGTYSLQNNTNWLKGRHSLSFGYQGQFIRIPLFDYANTVATYNSAISANSPFGFALGDIPGLRAGDLSQANSLLANLAGLIDRGTRSFNPTNATSGFVPGAPSVRNFSQDNHALYLSDSWKLRSRLTLVLGLRWDYYSVVNEKESLQLQPIVTNNDPFGTLLSNATLDLVGNSVGRPFYRPDRNNFAPNFGFAWDVFGTGKTALRGGYSIAFANDNTGNSITNTTNANAGLVGTTAFQNANANLRNLPKLDPPAFRIPITAQQAFVAAGGNGTLGLVDPRLATPYVQQWSFGLQHDLKGTLLEARYIGNHTVKLLRQIDANQINPQQIGFVEDFLRARSNGFLAAGANLGFDPAYNPSLPGSQLLTVIPTFAEAGALTNPTVRGQIQRGEVGALATTYATTNRQRGVAFFPNPFSLFAGLLTNQSSSSHNALQLELRRSWRNGGQLQANYTFAKTLTDANELRGLDPVLDNRNGRLERSRASFDTTQALKINHVIPLPFGKGRLLGGWSASGFLTVQTGAPVMILSARATLNRAGRSALNTVDTALNRSQLRDVVGFYQTGNGPYFIASSALGPDGRGVAPDGARPFTGQVFTNPQPGSLGGLQRRQFNGPSFRNYDFALLKSITIRERHSVQIRAEVFNLSNTPSFALGATQGQLDAVQNINNAAFGRVISTASTERQLQFSLYYRF